MIRRRLEIIARLKTNLYIPHTPTAKQLSYLVLDNEEAFYGGSAGGGKSDALLMAALQYVDYPGYAALLARRTFKALTLPEALLDRARTWLGPTNARWQNDSSAWVFPSSAKLVFGYLEADRDVEQYQSAAFQFVGFDELTQFSEYQYRYMHSRTRRLVGSTIPIRVRGASNPGSVGHDWVKQRFITEGQQYGRPFIPATLDDNPFLDRETYVKSLNNLDSITRQQLLNGDWSARHGGSKFRREWFGVVEAAPAEARMVRRWDLAATEARKGTDPDWTAGSLMAMSGQGLFYVKDIRHLRGTPGAVENLVRQTAQMDGRGVAIRMEQEPGSSGVNTIATYRKLLAGWDFNGVRSTGSKELRANPFASQVEAGNVKLVNGPWVKDFLDEAEVFPLGAHDDMLDATIGAFEDLTMIPVWGPV